MITIILVKIIPYSEMARCDLSLNITDRGRYLPTAYLVYARLAEINCLPLFDWCEQPGITSRLFWVNQRVRTRLRVERLALDRPQP